MNIGSLRHLVTIEGGPTPVPDPDGGYTDTYPTLAVNVPAAIEPATATDIERRVSNTVEAKVSHIVTMRYLTGVTTQTRVRFGSRVFYVRGVQNVGERNIELRLACEETV